MPLDLSAEHQRYFLADGTETEGASTVVGILGKGEGLNWWYWDLGRQGVEWKDIPKHQKKDLGSVIHGRVKAWANGYDGLDPTGLDPEWIEDSKAPFERFVNRFHDRKLTIVRSELEMVSESMRVGGTLDLEVEGPEGRGVIDIKSTKPYKKKPWTDLDVRQGFVETRATPMVPPYETALAQLGGYVRIRKEIIPGEPVHFAEIWRTGKTKDDPGQAHYVPNLPDWEAAFGICAQLYISLKEAKKRYSA